MSTRIAIKNSNSALPAPKNRAAVDSFLNSLADEPARALLTLPAASVEDGNEGDIVVV
jgi:hypothetical protein